MGEPSAFERNRCYFVDGPIDVNLMSRATDYLVGTHDFAAFQAAGGTPRETTVRTIKEIFIASQGEKLTISVTGDGFLYNMVRIIVGTLVEVGQGRRTPESVGEALESLDRTKAGHTAPPDGLYLAEIYFDREIKR